MSDQNKGTPPRKDGVPPRRTGVRRVKLPDGSWGVYMGETGGMRKRPVRPDQSAKAVRRAEPESITPKSRPDIEKIVQREPRDQRAGGGIISRYSLSKDERLAAEKRKNDIRERRKTAASEKIKEKIPERDPEQKKFYHTVWDRIRMWRLGISVNIDSIIKAAILGAWILIFAMLQVTVFSKLKPFGATPDLMLPLVIAIGITEGERWGGVSALAAAFLIDCRGSAGITLLPLLYVPCAFTAGILGTYYLRDSVVIRAILSVLSGILKAGFTVICVLLTFSSVSAPLMFKNIVFPEFISTLVFAIIPHLAVWLSMKPLHKTRAERVD